MVKYSVGNRVKAIDLPEELKNYYRDTCSYDTTAFQDLDDLPESLNLYNEYLNITEIPRGLEQELVSYLNNFNIPYQKESKDHLFSNHSFAIQPGIEYETGVFGYQGDAVRELIKHPTGRLKAPPGAGKTNCSCLAMAMIGKAPVLFLADNNNLLVQFRETVTEVLGIPEEEIGMIKGNKCKIKPITCGSLRTVVKHVDKLKNTFHTVFFDECHLSTALTFRTILLTLEPERLYGLSATPDHYASEDLNRLMRAMLGPIVVEIPESKIPKRLVPYTFSRHTGRTFYFDDDPSTPQWLKWKRKARLENDIIYNKERNNLIVEDCVKLVKQRQHKFLIATTRVAHGKVLKELLEAKGISCSFPYKIKETEDEEKALVDHKLLKKEVKEVLKGDIDGIIGTIKLFGTGFDCKNLSCVLMVGPFSGRNITQVEQIIGRILRYTPSKKEALALYYADYSSPHPRLQDWSEGVASFMTQKYGQHDIIS